MSPQPSDLVRDKRLATLAMVLVVPLPTIGVCIGMIWAPGTLVGKVGFMTCKAAMLLLPLLWRLGVERQPVSFSPVKNGGLVVGATLGIVISAAIVGAYMTFGRSLIDNDQVREMAETTGIASKSLFIAAAAYWICVNSVLEEYLYRWFLVEKGEVVFGRFLAIPMSALFFTIHHVIALGVQFGVAITIIGSFGVFIGGAAWSWCYARYRSIWPGWVSHAIVDVAVFGIGWWIIFGSAAASTAANGG